MRKKTLTEHLPTENIDFILSKKSDEYNFINDDYGIENTKKVQQDIIEFCKNALQKFKDHITLFDEIKIVFVKNIKGVLGRFRSGTSLSTPIIILSAKELMEGAKKYNVHLSVAVETTIYHELGHAICEMEYELGYECLEYDDEEEWVETFANNLYNYGEIPNDLKKFIAAVSQ